MMRAVAVMLAASASLASAQSVVVREAGPGPTGRALAATLAKTTTRVLIADTVVITKDSVFPGSVVVIGSRVNVFSEIKGDLIVVGGDLFIKPGGQIFGQGVAIGGGAYTSILGSARDGVTSFRDFTFDTLRVNGVLELRYREFFGSKPESAVQLPGVYGLRVPKYDRSSGMSLPVGPTLTLGGGRMLVEPLVTYRSQIGAIDPSLRIDWKTGRRFAVHTFAGREPRSNDTWITGDISNSVNSLFSGRDTRNWYRADRIQVMATRLVDRPAVTSIYRLGGQIEKASSARPDSFPAGGPWSFTGKTSSEGMWRINPQIPGGKISSVLAGANYAWTSTPIKSKLDVGVEVPLSTPNNTRFVQITIDGELRFPTFGLQSYRFDAHAILTRGDTADAQRFGYLGGAGTLSTVEPLLSIGGDELLFLESRYIIPIERISIPYAGSPTVTLRHILGAAAIQRMPALTQIIGFRVAIAVVRAEVMMDTADRKTEVHFGLSLVR